MLKSGSGCGTLLLFVFIWLPLMLICNAGLAQTQSPDLDVDVDLVNKNFKNMLGFRLNNFPVPDYVKNTRTDFNSGQLSFDIKFIDAVDFEENYKKAGLAVVHPFVSDDKIVFFVLYDEVADKVTAALDRGHKDYDEMLRAVDLSLLAVEQIFEMTSATERNEILNELATISKISDEKAREEAVMALVKKYLPPLKLVKLFAELRWRYTRIHQNDPWPIPGLDKSILKTMSFILGQDIVSVIMQFVTANLFAD